MPTDPESIEPMPESRDEKPDGGPPPRKEPPLVGVRYGYMKHVGEFTCSPKVSSVGCGEDVVIQTDRGIEMGKSLMLHCLERQNKLSSEQIDKYVAESGQDYYRRRVGRVLRVASEDDVAEYKHLQNDARGKLAYCAQLVSQHGLPMKLVQCEHLFGGERVIFYFMAEGRVDFRALVKDLAHEYQTRIEMRQVGARDEARLVADYETCGRECCCRVFLKTLRQVTMKMAKLQKATLDPSKVSGRCGRLKCCLRYEHVGYEELDQALPRTGTRLDTPEGPGVVIARQVLTQLLQIAKDAGGIVTYPLEDIQAWEDDRERREAEREAAEKAAREAKAAAPPRPPRDEGQRPKRSRSRRRPKPTPRDAKSEASTSKRPEPADRKPDREPPKRPDGPPASRSPGPQPPADGTSDTEGAPAKRRRRRPRRRGGRGKGPQSGDGPDRPPSGG